MAEGKLHKSNGTRQAAKSVSYIETLMYGVYQKDLGDFARKEAARIKAIQEKRRKSHPFKFYEPGRCDPLRRKCFGFRYFIASKIGEDWLFLTLLGVTMALLSFVMDYAIEKCQEAYKWMYVELSFSPPLQFLAWIMFPLIFICFSTGFVHIVGPNAIGSGIPEMKTILRGVVLKEYLTFRTLISKMVGLCTSLGSGLLIGKEGPFVHVASIAATLLGKFISSFQAIYENESRNSEMLAAACAVGVACTFAAPIGGVLFSIEVTSTYFAVRNYWRGFYAAVCGAFVFRLLAIWFKDEETLTALFKTNLRQDLPFDPIELFAFALIGLVCGFAGALFVYLHRKIVEFIRGQRRMTTFLQKNRFIFPSVIVFILSSLTCPLGLGQYMAGHLTNGEAVNMLFSNVTWSTTEEEDLASEQVSKHWKGPHNNLYLTLALFILMRFWMSAVAITLPIPAGVFMPVFTIGAAFGRLVGEAMATWFPAGIYGKQVVPGGYAIVGAAALSGSVTHTISTSVIVFELTGQMGHVLPAVIAVLISNAIAHCLQLSIYDSLIQIKKLPYLPDMINPGAIGAHTVRVEDFMKKRLDVLTGKATYKEVYDMLQNHRYRAYPIVDNTENMFLVGSIQRAALEQKLEVILTPGPNMTFLPDDVAPETPQVNGTRGSQGESQGESQGAATKGAWDFGSRRSPSNKDVDISKATSAGGSLSESEVSPTVESPSSPPESATKPTPRKFRFSVSKVDETASISSAAPPSVAPIQEEEPAPSTNPLRSILKPYDQTDIKVTPDDFDMDYITHFERIQLKRPVDYTSLIIDPAPFQLVPQTSLYKVHTIFSLLSLNHAYVTCSGRLVGVVGLKELRLAVQGHVNTIEPKKMKRPHGTPSMKRKAAAKLTLEDNSGNRNQSTA